uniref:SGNH/GDSL hydrolase family protein n=1 Tax=Acetatifactor sp. TaxID=1872090 RepID=UPI004055B95C
MSNKFTVRKKHIIFISIAIFIITISTLFLFFLPSLKALKSDFSRIASEEYDTVFLSMFPIGNYDEADFVYWRGQNTLKTSYELSGMTDLRTYMKKITESGNFVNTVYLGVRPDKLAPDKLLELIREYPAIHFHIVLAHPAIDYWTELSGDKRTSLLGEYRHLTDTLLPESNVSVYSFLREWLMCNPTNYDDTFLTTVDASLTIFLHCDRSKEYYITPDTVDRVFAELSALIEKEAAQPPVYPDLIGHKIVFFGDSVFANYTDNLSIPGVVNALTGAKVYNCGYGGNTASDYFADPITLPGIVNAFINEDISSIPTEEQIYNGMSQYFNDTSSTDNLCFVINYGLNDYFIGAPVTAENPYDTGSYIGAFRTSIETLQNAFPDAQIILMAPNFTSYFENGTEKMSETGGILTDYVDAIVALGTEYEVDIINNYAELGIDATNHGLYLLDGCHPNQQTRFTIGSRIAQLIR